MREIKFRGKRVDNSEWVYGYYVFRPDGNHFIYWKPFEDASQNTYHKVIPETLGQFTGLTDKNVKEIFEGDFCKDTDGRILEVGWSDKFSSFVLMNKKWAFKHWFGESCDPEEVEVIGNIHDNPELCQP